MRLSDYLPRSAFDTAVWRKATASDPEQSCVELATAGDVIGVRDSKVPDGPILQFNRDEIRARFASKDDLDRYSLLAGDRPEVAATWGSGGRQSSTMPLPLLLILPR